MNWNKVVSSEYTIIYKATAKSHRSMCETNWPMKFEIDSGSWTVEHEQSSLLANNEMVKMEYKLKH